VLECDAPPVLALGYRFRKAAMVSLHNFSDAAQTVHLKLNEPGGERLVDLLGEEHSKAAARGRHEIALDATATAGSASGPSMKNPDPCALLI
jgi:Sucrose hydrolase-like, C-terminal domain